MGSGLGVQTPLKGEKYVPEDNIVIIPFRQLSKKLRAYQHYNTGEILVLIDTDIKDVDTIKNKSDWFEAVIDQKLQSVYMETINFSTSIELSHQSLDKAAASHTDKTAVVAPTKQRSNTLPLNLHNTNKDSKEITDNKDLRLPRQYNNHTTVSKASGEMLPDELDLKSAIDITKPSEISQRTLITDSRDGENLSKRVNGAERSEVMIRGNMSRDNSAYLDDSRGSKKLPPYLARYPYMVESHDASSVAEKMQPKPIQTVENSRVGIDSTNGKTVYICKLCNCAIHGGHNKEIMEEHVYKCESMSQLKHKFDDINLKLGDVKIDLSQKNYHFLRIYIVKILNHFEQKCDLSNSIIGLVKQVLKIKHTDVDSKALDALDNELELKKREIFDNIKAISEAGDNALDGEPTLKGEGQRMVKEENERYYNHLEIAQKHLKMKRDLLRFYHRYYLTVSDFTFIRMLSEGAYAKVYLAQKNIDKRMYALKVIEKSLIRNRKMSDQVFTELKVLTNASTYPEYFVRFSLSFQTNKHLFITTEFIPGGDCMQFLQHNKKFNEDIARYLLAEVCLGLKTLHYHHVVHKDIKPDNIMITSSGHIKIVDFGLCAFFDHPHEHHSVAISSSLAVSASSNSVSTPLSYGSNSEQATSAAINSGLSNNQAIAKVSQQNINWNGEDHNFTGHRSSSFFLKNSKASASSSKDSYNDDSSSNSVFIATRGLERVKPDNLIRGSIHYLCPELIKNEWIENQASIDWWAFGVLMFHFLSGHSPFDGDIDSEISHSITNQTVNWNKFPSTCSKSSRNFLEAILERPYPQRLGTLNSDEIVLHPYFSGELIQTAQGDVGPIKIDANLYKNEGPLIINAEKAEQYFDEDPKLPFDLTSDSGERQDISDEFVWFTRNNF